MDYTAYIWPPSEQSRPVYEALVVVLVSMMILMFRMKESKYTKKANEEKKDRCCHGMRLLLDDVEKKDKADDKGKERTTGLPESSRVYGFLWDDVHEVPTTSYGIPGQNPDILATQELLQRVVTSEFKKAMDFTEAALRIEKCKQIRLRYELQDGDSTPKQMQTSKEEDANAEWLEKNETTEKEVLEYISGEKLEGIEKFVKKVEKEMGKYVFSPAMASMKTRCKDLLKEIKGLGKGAFSKVFSMFLRAVPGWLLSVLFAVLGEALTSYMFKTLNNGVMLVAATGIDGTFDVNKSYDIARTLFTVTVLARAADLTSGLLLNIAKMHFTLILKDRFMKCLLFQDYEYFERNGPAVLQERLNSDVAQVGDSILSLPKDFIQTLSCALINLFIAKSCAPNDLFLLALLPLPFVVYGNHCLMEWSTKQAEKGRKISEQSTSATQEVISNIATVRGMATEQMEVNRYKRSGKFRADIEQWTYLVSETGGQLFFLILMLNICFLSYMACQKVAAGEMLKEDVMNFQYFIGFGVVFPLQGVFKMIPSMLKMMIPLQRVVTHLNSQSKIEPNPMMAKKAPINAKLKSSAELNALLANLETVQCKSEDSKFPTFVQAKEDFKTLKGHSVEKGFRMTTYMTANGEERHVMSLDDLNPTEYPIKVTFVREFMPVRFRGHILFDSVKFYFPSDLRKSVMDELSFEVKPGQKIGLCGHAGCGKSTTFLLLQRFYDVDSSGGAVLIDNVDIRKYNVHFLRRKIGMVAQKPVLFKMSVKDNISYGMLTPPSDEEIKKTLEQAQAWDFIDEKPDKLLTMLTETGGGFSGGQMQRLVIARSLIRKPDVMLLDEATSALDPVNERAVQDTLDKVMKGFTTIFIAHRLTTIKDADKIIVIDHGKVVEEGTHTELLNIPIKHEKKDGKETVISGFYHNQWDTQFNEKDLKSHQIKDKMVQLEMELENHRARYKRITKNMSRMKVVGVLGAMAARHQKFEDTIDCDDNESSANAHNIPLDRFVTGVEEYHDD